MRSEPTNQLFCSFSPSAIFDDGWKREKIASEYGRKEENSNEGWKNNINREKMIRVKGRKGENWNKGREEERNEGKKKRKRGRKRGRRGGINKN